MKTIYNYLHLYIPFEFEWIEDAVPFHKGERGVINAEDLKYWDEYKKPLLRPVSDMTEEEAIEIFRLPVKADEVFFQTGEEFRIMLYKGFDLFGLIESGMAIDKTKSFATQ